MKKFLSALTAFCMCASMTAASLPASALTLSDTSVINTKADAWTWSLGDYVYTPGVDEEVHIEIKVSGDQGTFGYEFTPLVDGKTFKEAGFDVLEISQTSVYNFGTFQVNPTNSHVGAASKVDGDKKAADGDTIIDMYVVPPADAAPGTKYVLSFKDLIVGNESKVRYEFAGENGSITIAGGSEQQDTTQAPTQGQDPTEPATMSMDDKKNSSTFTWYMDDVTYDPAADPDGTDGALVKVYVTKDPGTGGYDFTPLIDGKTASEAGFEILEISQTKVYNFETFQVNPKNGHVGAASKKEGVIKAADGDAIIEMYLLPPSDAAPGTKYTLTFKDLTVGSSDGSTKMTADSIPGSITIVKDQDPTEPPTTEAPTTEAPTTQAPTTEAPTTEAPTTEAPTTQAPTTEPYVEKTSEVAGFVWDIGEVECEAGETVYVPVTVAGNVGFNSYIANIKADAGITAVDPKAGSLAGLANVQANLTAGKYGATNPDDKADVTGDGEVFYLGYTVPADAAPGTIYNLSFASVDVFNMDMVKLIPTTDKGYIKVKEAPTTEPPTTEAPTTEPFVEKVEQVDAEWIIGTTEVDAGASVDLPITVKGDKGLNSYIAKITADLAASDAAAGDAYAALSFEKNVAAMTFGATYTEGLNVTAADDSTVFTLHFDVPADAAPGTLYNVKWADLTINNGDMVRLKPVQVDGWIKIKEPETTEAPTTTTEAPTTTTEAPTTTTEAPTTTTEPNETEPVTDDPSKVQIKIDAEWAIGTTEVAPGATVTLPVTVTGDADGLSGYVAKLEWDSALTAESAEAGNAYSALAFEYNLKTAQFGQTGAGDVLTAKAGDGDTVFYVTFKVPDDAKNGDLYEVNWADLEIRNKDYASLIPTTTDGWIKVVDETEPIELYEYEYSLNGTDKFFLSHDPRPFQDIVSSDATMKRRGKMTDGTYTDWTEISVKTLTSIVVATAEGDYTNPKDAFDALGQAYVKVALKATITDKLPNGESIEAVVTAENGFVANAIIGVKGDTDLNGICDAVDASQVLMYSAALGAGEADAKICENADAITALGDETAQTLSYFLSDTDGESTTYNDPDSPVNAVDASNQLVFAAHEGGEGTGSTNWATDVLDPDNLPPITKEIAAYKG